MLGELRGVVTIGCVGKSRHGMIQNASHDGSTALDAPYLFMAASTASRIVIFLADEMREVAG